MKKHIEFSLDSAIRRMAAGKKVRIVGGVTVYRRAVTGAILGNSGRRGRGFVAALSSREFRAMWRNPDYMEFEVAE